MFYTVCAVVQCFVRNDLLMKESMGGKGFVEGTFTPERGLKPVLEMAFFFVFSCHIC